LRVLFVSPYAPTPIRRRPYEFLRALVERGHEVTLAAIVGNRTEQDVVERWRGTLEDSIALPVGRVNRLRGAAGALLRGLPMQARFDWSPAAVDRLRAIAGSGRFDVVHVEHFRGAAYGLALRDLAPIAWDAVDSIDRLFELAQRRAPTSLHRIAARLERAPSRRYERRAARQLHATVITSARDADGLAGGDPETRARIRVIPNGVDLEFFRPPDGQRDPDSVVMAGKLSYHANIAAALWMIDSVMPELWRRRPSARLILAGAGPKAVLRARAERSGGRINVTGEVADMGAVLRSAGVVVAPLVYGVGIQNKVLEAMACAAPLVVTPAASGELGIEPGRECAVEAEPSAFAAAIADLMGDERRGAAMGAAGRAYVEAHHTWSGAEAKLEEAYAEAMARRDRQRGPKGGWPDASSIATMGLVACLSGAIAGCLSPPTTPVPEGPAGAVGSAPGRARTPFGASPAAPVTQSAAPDPSASDVPDAGVIELTLQPAECGAVSLADSAPFPGCDQAALWSGRRGDEAWFGALLFRAPMESVPEGARLSAAELVLTGLDGSELVAGGTWMVRGVQASRVLPSGAKVPGSGLVSGTGSGSGSEPRTGTGEPETEGAIWSLARLLVAPMQPPRVGWRLEADELVEGLAARLRVPESETALLGEQLRAEAGWLALVIEGPGGAVGDARRGAFAWHARGADGPRLGLTWRGPAPPGGEGQPAPAPSRELP